MGYCSNTNCARRFRCEDSNVDLMCVQPYYYRVRQVDNLLGALSGYASPLIPLVQSRWGGGVFVNGGVRLVPAQSFISITIAPLLL